MPSCGIVGSGTGQSEKRETKGAQGAGAAAGKRRHSEPQKSGVQRRLRSESIDGEERLPDEHGLEEG